MTSYNLYDSLGLDRSRTADQLDAELGQRLAGVTRETPEFYELDAARSVLGDATKRSMYDQRLDSDTEVTVTDIQHLAAMNVHGASAGASGAGTGVVGKATDAVKSTYAQYPKATIGVGVLSAAVVVALVGAIVSVTGGSDDESSTASSSQRGSSSSSDSISDNDPNAKAKRAYQKMTFLNEGDSVSFGDSKKWEYPDGEVKYEFPDGFKYKKSISNLRTFDKMTIPDPEAPDDHPDSKSQLEATFVCVDETIDWEDQEIKRMKDGEDEIARRLNSEPSDIDDDELVLNASKSEFGVDMQPVVEGSYLLKSGAMKNVAGGKPGVESYEDLVGVDIRDFPEREMDSNYRKEIDRYIVENGGSTDGLAEGWDEKRFNRLDDVMIEVEGNKATRSTCRTVSETIDPDPDDITGYVIPSGSPKEGSNSDDKGWKLDL